MKKSIFFYLFLLISGSISAQISVSQTEEIDKLTAHWNEPNHPGGVIGVLKNNELVYSKAFGLASMEYQIPNETTTIFNTGSVSKQFTAMGIVLLHLQGKLSVDDNIRLHLPDLPDFGHPITIRHMLHHTSGLRSLHALFSLAGWRSDDSRSNADIYRFMLRQQELNFEPGSEYLYCNTGYMLMVNIIEKVTGENFKEWMNAQLFKPLGMEHTFVEDNYRRIVQHKATSYYKISDKFERAVAYWGYIGSGNMSSTTDDLLKWLSNFHSPQSGWEAAFKMMETVDAFNDGSPNDYAFGVLVNEHLGTKAIGHNGAIGGFRAAIRSYPEEELNIAVLTNFSTSSPGLLLNKIGEIVLGEGFEIAEEVPVVNDYEYLKLSANELKKFEGHYWNDISNYSRKIYVKKDTLFYNRGGVNENQLAPIGKNSFKMLGVAVELIVRFSENEKGTKKMDVKVDKDAAIESVAYDPSEAATDPDGQYIGSYWSPELETLYTISIKEGKLEVHHPRHGDFSAQVLKKDVLQMPGNTIGKFQRNDAGVISGIRLSNGRARNVWFKKMIK